MTESIKQYGKSLAAFFAICTAILFCLLTGCTDKTEPLKVGMSMDYKPYAFIEGQLFVGYDTELAQFLSNKLNRKLELVKTDFPKLFEVLKEGKVDALISAISITEDRAQRCDFSVPYSGARFAFMFKEKAVIDSLDDLKGKKVGVVSDTVMHQWCKDNADSIGFTTHVYDNNLQILGDDRAGDVDVCLVEEQNARALMKTFTEYRYSIVTPENQKNRVLFSNRCQER